MASTGPFHPTWSSRAFGAQAELVHRKIAAALLQAQQNMVEAHSAGRLKTNHVYGNMFRSVYENLVEQFDDEITDIEGFGTVKVKGYSFLIVLGWLLYPIRYADKVASPHSAKIRASKLRQAVLTELGPEPSQPPLDPEFDELEQETEVPSLPEVLEELKGRLEVSVIAFTSSVEAGVMQAYVGQPELTEDRLFWNERIDPISLVPYAGGEGQAPPGTRLPQGPSPAGPRFGQGAEPDITLVPKPRHEVPSGEPEEIRPNIQNDE